MMQSNTRFSNRSGWLHDVSDCKSMFAAKVLKDKLIIPCCTEVTLEKSMSQYSCKVGKFAVITAQCIFICLFSFSPTVERVLRVLLSFFISGDSCLLISRVTSANIYHWRHSLTGHLFCVVCQFLWKCFCVRSTANCSIHYQCYIR